MITLYSGTPGSGKSYQATALIYRLLKRGNTCVISNFDINRSLKKLNYDNFFYIENMNVENVQNIVKDFQKNKKYLNVNQFEHSAYIFIDECQLIFNSRNWKNNNDWCKLFSIHRHLGMQFILISQYDRMIDKQIRACIEIEKRHRKVSNYNLFFYMLALPFRGNLFYQLEIYYPLGDKVGGGFFVMQKKVCNLYNTFKLFD